MEQLVELEFTGETEVLRRNLPQCYFVHHKSHMIWPGTKSWLEQQEGESKHQVLTEEKLYEIGAAHEHSPQNHSDVLHK
jgi:hypothetical protein